MSSGSGAGPGPARGANPFTFRIPEPPFGQQFFVSDLNGDGRPDFSYRSRSRLYAFDDRGQPMWALEVANPQDLPREFPTGGGAAHGAGDVDGDGVVEVVALDQSGHLHVIDGRDGRLERTVALPRVGANNRWMHVAVANLRGRGDRDVVLQTVDDSDTRPSRFVNRNLLAWDLEHDRELWRVLQDADLTNGIYEGYWGTAHGSFRLADVDGDGMDEVVGGNLVEEDGTVVDLGYPDDWVGVNERTGFVDHLDAIAIGDFRADLPGLEWVVTEEDHAGNSDFHVALLASTGLVWRVETDLFPEGGEREPQNVAVGDFEPDLAHSEVWVRSRFPLHDDGVTTRASQHPWVLSAFGSRIADYATGRVLPAGFNLHENGNCQGLEMIAPIRWAEGGPTHIAGKARHLDGEVGVFDALTGSAVWYTSETFPSVEAEFIYVADVVGDGREEVVIYDARVAAIRVYANPDAVGSADPQGLLQDPDYRRLKQNWNYYSP